MQSVGGVCAIDGDSLLFYYTGFAGNDAGSMHANGATGVAKLRRDGFVSLRAAQHNGVLTTRQMVSDHPNYLFVNVVCEKGDFRVEILDENSQPLPGFGAEDCDCISVDSTCQMVTWKGNGNLDKVLNPGSPFRLRFRLSNGELYSFWLSPDAQGHSMGYVGAGGKGFVSNVDRP